MEMTVEALIQALQKFDGAFVVRVKMTHDLDCVLAEQGPIVGVSVKAKRGLVLLDCADDVSHGFGQK